MDMVDIVQTLTTILLTIAYNQHGNLIPDRENVIDKLVTILDSLGSLRKDD